MSMVAVVVATAGKAAPNSGRCEEEGRACALLLYVAKLCLIFCSTPARGATLRFPCLGVLFPKRRCGELALPLLRMVYSNTI